MDMTTEVVHGWRLLARVQELLDEPDVQQVVVRHDQGDSLISIDVSSMRSDLTTRPVLLAVKAIADELSYVLLEVMRSGGLGRQVGESITNEEFDRAIDVIEPVFERY
ncbi:DUF4342 domain-containing protein [Chloroflexus sp.]|uniref:DUF4342 domain-containing protein n=1 Tax=Chloroflexus sp. TaxID=1904827 RepID=UPI002ADE2197|nr:DUF4342 domain-containing protein [Chloroflexus sp.]